VGLTIAHQIVAYVSPIIQRKKQNGKKFEGQIQMKIKATNTHQKKNGADYTVIKAEEEKS
jgi:hypothetical protein